MMTECINVYHAMQMQSSARSLLSCGVRLFVTLIYRNGQTYYQTFHRLEEALEKVQKKTTKTVPHLKHLMYSEQTHYRRIRGDMIETFKILTGKYDMI